MRILQISIVFYFILILNMLNGENSAGSTPMIRRERVSLNLKSTSVKRILHECQFRWRQYQYRNPFSQKDDLLISD